MSGKYLVNSSGTPTEAASIDSSTGVSDADKIVSTGADGKLDITLMPPGIAPETDSVKASENISAGNFVNIYTSGGFAFVRKADASTSGKEANGFLLSSCASGDDATVYRASQTNNQLVGLTSGATYYLDPGVPGGVTDIPPTTSGGIIQIVGKAISSTTLSFFPFPPIGLL